MTRVELYTSLNNGQSWWPEGATEPWYIVTINELHRNRRGDEDCF